MPMEKVKVSRGEATSFGFKGSRPNSKSTSPHPLPSVAANVTKETIEPIVIPTLPKHGTNKEKPKKEVKAANRFGFRPMAPMSNKVADLQVEGKQEKEEPVKPPVNNALKLTGRRNSPDQARHRTASPAQPIQVRAELQSKSQGDVGKFTLHSSHLPRPQCPVRLSTIKSAKTAANRQTASILHSAPTNAAASSANKFGYRLPKGKVDPLKLEIEHLEESPSVTLKYRQLSQQKRPNEITFSPSRNKTFSLRDLHDNRGGDNLPNHGTPPRNHQSTPSAMVQPHLTTSQCSTSSNGSHLMTTSIESYGEEKHKRDLESSEKDTVKEEEDACVPDELWGHGEAMALEEGLSCIEGIDQSPVNINIALRSVLLKIEDPMFASLAALSSSDMLEDEKTPESIASPDLSCSPPSVEPLPPPPQLKDSPGTPISPTHGSNSCSSDARDRDFLIDDEIADQPGLVFNDPQQGVFLPDAITSLAGQVSKVLASLNVNESPGGLRDRANSTSIGTLSACDSLASDDLMADFETSINPNNIEEMDASDLNSELEIQKSHVMKEWNSILTAHPGLSTSLDGTGRIRSRVASRTSVAPSDSPKSHQSSIPSPRKIVNNGTISPADDGVSVDSGIRVDKSTYHTMLQEVIELKTMLLRLKRVLKDSKSLDSFDMKNGDLYSEVSSEAVCTDGAYVGGEGQDYISTGATNSETEN